MTTKSLSILIGIVFLAAGLLGFIPNPIVGSGNALFHTDALHNAVHLLSGALFVLVAISAPASVASFMKVFGIVYFMLGVLGLVFFGMSGEGHLLGFLHVNGADNFLHMGLGLVIYICSMARPVTHAVTTSTP